MNIAVDAIHTNANTTKRIAFVKVFCDRLEWTEKVTLGRIKQTAEKKL